MKTDEGVFANERARACATGRRKTPVFDGLWRRAPIESARLIVEADGSQHGESIRDERRDAYLAGQGWAVVRFWNHDIPRNRESVIDTLLARAGLPW